MTIHKGGCHCGKVSFEVEAPADIEAVECNCSICSMTGFLHLFVSRRALKLLTDEAAIQTYTFGSHTAQHYFCRYSGIKTFYVPRSHPDGVSVNARCLEPGSVAEIRSTPFDGANWEDHVAELPSLDPQPDPERSRT